MGNSGSTLKAILLDWPFCQEPIEHGCLEKSKCHAWEGLWAWLKGLGWLVTRVVVGILAITFTGVALLIVAAIISVLVGGGFVGYSIVSNGHVTKEVDLPWDSLDGKELRDSLGYGDYEEDEDEV